MRKPILVTVLNNNTIEVLTDYKLNIKSARTPKGPLSILRVESEVGLIGAMWNLEREEELDSNETLSILASIGEQDNEYSFRL